MKKYKDLNELEKRGVKQELLKLGFSFTTYYTAGKEGGEKGMATKYGIGFLLSDLIIDG